MSAAGRSKALVKGDSVTFDCITKKNISKSKDLYIKFSMHLLRWTDARRHVPRLWIRSAEVRR